MTNRGVKLEELKEKFYQNEYINFPDEVNFRKKNFSLKQFYVNKIISLSDYNKREFTRDKKNTKPLTINHVVI